MPLSEKEAAELGKQLKQAFDKTGVSSDDKAAITAAATSAANGQRAMHALVENAGGTVQGSFTNLLNPPKVVFE